MAQPAEPRKLTPEEEAALAATGAPPVEPGMYEEPYVAPGQYADLGAPPLAPMEPGMYEDQYQGPGIYSTSTAHLYPPPISTKTGAPSPLNSSHPSFETSAPGQPGWYEPPYRGPGQWATQHPPLEPGIYDERYIQPGVAAPRAASTYYGGPVWPLYNTGAAHPSASGKPLAGVFTSYPASGAPATRRFIPSGGTEILPVPPEVGGELPPMPGAQNVGDIFGEMSGGNGSAPPQPLATIAPTSGEAGYLSQQGDPAYVERPRLQGAGTHPVLRRDLSKPLVDRLAGLFGGGERKSSQEMPLPPGTRRPVRNRGNH